MKNLRNRKKEYTTKFVAKSKQLKENSEEKQSIHMICKEDSQNNKVIFNPTKEEKFNDLLKKYIKKYFHQIQERYLNTNVKINITEGEPI